MEKQLPFEIHVRGNFHLFHLYKGLSGEKIYDLEEAKDMAAALFKGDEYSLWNRNDSYATPGYDG